MKNYTIGESYTLPSEGKIYDTMVVPTVKLRSMTTEEEMKRLSPSDYPFKNMCEILDDCMIESPGISSYDMCVGDYQFLLHKLRVVTYGKDYKITTKCPYCGYASEHIIDLDELPVMMYNEKLEELKEFDLPVSKRHIRLKVQTPRMLDSVKEKVKEFKKKSDNKVIDPTVIYAISELIETIDGKKPNVITLEQWIRELPMKDTNTILAYAEKLNDSLGIDTNLQLDCSLCGLDFNSALTITSEFFRPALNIGW